MLQWLQLSLKCFHSLLFFYFSSSTLCKVKHFLSGLIPPQFPASLKLRVWVSNNINNIAQSSNLVLQKINHFCLFSTPILHLYLSTALSLPALITATLYSVLFHKNWLFLFLYNIIICFVLFRFTHIFLKTSKHVFFLPSTGQELPWCCLVELPFCI